MKQSAFQFTTPSLITMAINVNRDFEHCNEEVEITMSMRVEVQRKENEKEATVDLHLEIGDESSMSPYHLIAVEEARFRWHEDLPEDKVNNLLNQNAPSLLLSYLRPVVMQTTSVTPFGGYDIPFINFTAEN